MDPHFQLLIERQKQALERYLADVAERGSEADASALKAAQAAVERVLAGR